MALSPAPPSRYVALDIGKQSAMVGAVDSDRRVVLTPRPIALDELERWMFQHLRPSDSVVVDAPAEAWQLHDRLSTLVGSVTVAHPQLANLLPASAGARDMISLARLHAAGLVPALWVPPAHVRDLRALAAHRRRLLIQRAEGRETLHGLLRRYRLNPPGLDRLGADQLEWWASLDIPAGERARARASLDSIARAEALLADLEQRLLLLSDAEPWRADIERLMRLPGMSQLSAALLLAGIGEIARFPSASQLVGYAALGDGSRGDDHAGERGGKDGRRDLRATMIDVAWAAIRDDERWRATFEGLEARIGRSRAIVATARKLLLRVWETLAAPAATPAAELAERPVRRAA